MKKTFAKITALVSAAACCVSLASCTAFTTMRERAAMKEEIISTPEQNKIVAELNDNLVYSSTAAESLSENISYSISSIEIEGDEGSDVSLLKKARGTLKSMITAQKPGASSDNIAPVDFSGTLLGKFDEAKMLGVSVERNYQTEKVTNEKGNEITDEHGNSVTEVFIADNIATTVFNYYEDKVITEETTDEDGNRIDAVTERIPADSAAIEEVFGEPADKAEVLAALDSIAAYIQVSDYTVEYTNCRVESKMNISTNEVDFVGFDKNMLVTVTFKGAGEFEHLSGVMTLSLCKNIDYTFNYPVEELN